MPSKLLSLVAAACLSAALASCGSGPAGLAKSEGGELPGREAAGWERAIDDLDAAKNLASETISLAELSPSATAIKRARDAANAYVEAAEAAVAAAERLRSAGGGDLQARAQRELSAAQSGRDASQRRLNILQEALGESSGPGGDAGSGESAGSLAQRLENLRSRTLTSLERGPNYRISSRHGTHFHSHLCSESAGTCFIGGFQQGGNDYLNPAFFHTPSATPLAAASANGVDSFSEHRKRTIDDVTGEDWKLLALGQFSAARTHILTDYFPGTTLYQVTSYGVALGERHAGRPSGTDGGSATWRGRMVGAAMDNGSPLAGESALTYSFGDNTVDVRISGIRAIGDASYTGGASLTWTGLAVNSDGSFYISGYNNDRPGLTLISALHPTLGYIDGDFYGPNAEEAAGIFTRDNVNGAFLAGSRGWRTSADDETPSDGGQTPSDEEPPSEGGQAEQGGNTLSLAQRLENLGSRTLTSLERGHNYSKSSEQATHILDSSRCSESAGTCIINRNQQAGNAQIRPAFFNTRSATPLAAASANGVDSFSEHRKQTETASTTEQWKLLALGQFSAALISLWTVDYPGTTPRDRLISYGVAFGERHGRPSGASGSATWRGGMVGAAMDSASPLAGESALTYSFGDNTVDVRISGIRAVGDASYTGGTSLTWSGLAVNSDGSFYIPGYNNDRSDLTLSSALHPTLGYIDGDFYGPNAEEAAGIFTRGNVNGAFLAKK